MGDILKRCMAFEAAHKQQLEHVDEQGGSSLVTFQPRLDSMASTRDASFLYSTKTRMRFLREAWYLRSSSSRRRSLTAGSSTSTTCAQRCPFGASKEQHKAFGYSYWGEAMVQDSVEVLSCRDLE